MDEVKLADSNDIQAFFNCSHSASASETFSTSPIDVKDFIGWCNGSCDSISKRDKADSAYNLGKTICVLNELSNEETDEIKGILKETISSSEFGHSDIKVPLSKKEIALRKEMITAAREKLWGHVGLQQALKKHLSKRIRTSPEYLPENAAFYCAIKLQLKDRPDERRYYRYQFDDSGNTIAQIDPLKPFVAGENNADILDQKWHVLISLLAFLDVAHALSNDQHECHCLYPYLCAYDKGDLGEGKLQLKSSLSLNVIKGNDYTSEAMMTWIKNALVKATGSLSN